MRNCLPLAPLAPSTRTHRQGFAATVTRPGPAHRDNRRPDSGAASGFALVIALTLMSFLLVLTVSLSVLVHVDLASTNQSFTHLRAQRAAVLALESALGELQKSAGPDQRVTARADILEGGYSGLTPNAAKAHWTGVWRSDHANPLAPDSKTFVGWLASMSANNSQLGAITGTVSNPVTLVSKRTDSAGATIPAVEAESIAVDGADVAYAWVVLDEGIKAKLNPRTWEENDAIYTATGQLSQALRFGPSEGGKIDALDGLETFSQKVSARQRSRFTSLAEADIFYETDPASGYFHDLTASGYGVLTDVKNGGLRRDLTRGLSDQLAELTGRQVLDVFPIRWDSLAAWYNLYHLLSNPDGTLPVLDPRDTLPADWTGSREEFDVADIETVPLANGGIRDWQLTSHPIAPVVQQVIWRFGGVTSDYKAGQSTWAWRDDRPSGDSNQEKWAYLKSGRHVVSPLVVLWNPYNIALDASDYRVTYDPAVKAQIVARNTDSTEEKDLFSVGMTDLVDLWQNSNSTTRTGHFTLELFSTYNRNDRTISDQTTLQPGEMKIFALRFEDTGGYNAENSYGGGFGGWGSNQTPVQLVGPENGDAHITFRGAISSQGIAAPNVNLDWIQDRLELDFGTNTASTDPNDFRLTLSLAEANYGGAPEDGFVLRDVWGLRPPDSASGSYPFASLWTRNASSPGEDLTLYDYYDILLKSNLMTSPNNADILYAANLVARLKTGETELGADSLPFIAHFNPLAWHTRAGHPDEVHSPIWDVSVLNRSDWNSRKPLNTALSGTTTWGNSVSNSGQRRVVLKEIPRQPLFSVGQFMHADIGVFDTAPLYTVGGSYAPPFGGLTERIYTDGATIDGNDTALEAIDLSWYYNDALFDAWFFSTVPTPTQSTQYPPFEDFNLDYIRDGKPLPNSRYRYFSDTGTFDSDYEDRLRDIDTAAASLMVDGAFNVNSTSIPAWKSMLSSLQQSAVFRYYNVAGGSDSEAQLEPAEMEFPIPRFLHPMASSRNAQDSDEPQAWAGFRSLNGTELDALATAIVEQVRLRGPFLSLSDFVNRRLVDGPTGISGALQTALDQTVNNADNFGGEPEQDSIWGEAVNWEQHAPASAAGAPGWVLQNDILQMLAPVLSARSDTFRIRAYGAALSPLTGTTEAETWCEAIVQRVPNWMDATDAPEDSPSTAANNNFGRRFVLVSFRWLPPSEI
ncbi:hypothetical protein H5P28_11950 [Ruficoccus amylovorans]|uniref:Verru_Chthon cassette protein A n=1 Tax=Ruficoccus amylovorans TaxID=1804625 RepID=A0A842HFH3_9BACT|nr:hypothetical protein [Ruficoccus amylovorans]MBC2594970.1 hypothetical protein [Ruficoccus amylovorans]